MMAAPVFDRRRVLRESRIAATTNRDQSRGVKRGKAGRLSTHTRQTYVEAGAMASVVSHQLHCT